MLHARPIANRCIYCAFRSRQRLLQAQRHRSTSSASNTAPDHIERLFFFGRRSASEHPLSVRRIAAEDHEPARRGRPSEAKPGPRIRRLSGNETRRETGGKTKGDARFSIRKNGIRYEDALQDRLPRLRRELKDAPLVAQIQREQEENGEQIRPFEDIWDAFVRSATSEAKKSWTGLMQGVTEIKQDLRDTFQERGIGGLGERIKYHFYAHLTGTRFTASEIDNQKALADLRYPTEWFPATRSYRRNIHLHVGPTNSGKTYHALQALEKAKSGIYAGPLRLLAHEVYSRMNAKGKPCMLVTGEERRTPEIESDECSLNSCTVEMVPMNAAVEVAVIDEIQMIGDPQRGWAWTQALLGVMAREVHLCGEARTVPLIQELCAAMGENLEIHRYERLSPLELAEESLDGDLTKLRKGDCIVSFSVMSIHALRKQIEQQTGKKVATVYGSLPPETRAQQAKLFNDPDNDYDFLVASDAVGMGLNLAIKRMIFEASSKWNGSDNVTLSTAEIKQIAGRAGRYRTAHQVTETPTSEQNLAAAKGEVTIPAAPAENNSKENVGIVTTLEQFDLPIVAAAMATEPEPIRSAGIFPPNAIVERFASYFPPGTPFSYILTRLHELSQMHSRFHLCGLKDTIWVADLIEPVKGLTVNDRNIICSVPAGRADIAVMWNKLMPVFATHIAEQTVCNVVEVPDIPLEILEKEFSASRAYLGELERLHKALVAYLWLSYRFHGIFNTRALARHAKALVEDKIEHALRQFSFSETARKKITKERQAAQQKLLEDIQQTFTELDQAVEGEEEVEGSKFEGEVGDVNRYENDTNLPPSSLIAATEEDEVLAEEPLGEDLENAIEPETTSTSSAAAWRSQQAIPDLSVIREELDTPLSEAVQAGQEASVTDHQSPPVPDTDGTENALQEPNIPPKHLALLDADATEAERNLVSRP